jgi:hypothetical protein
MAEFKLGRIRFVWKGAWAPATAYLVDDVISSGGKSYICVINHTSATLFETDIEAVPSKWNIVADGVSWRDNWEPEEYYTPGNLVKYGGSVYLCTASHTSATFEAPTFLGLEEDIGNWDLFATAFNWTGEWAADTRYKLNDFVNYGGTTYLCTEHHVSASATGDIVVTGASGDGEFATLTYATQVIPPFKVGDDITVAEIDPAGYNGTFTVTACTTGSVSFASAEEATYVEGGVITGTSKLGLEKDSGKWDEFNKGIIYLGEWSSATSVRYKENDVVKYGANLWICITPHTSESDWLLDQVNWDLFLGGFEYEDSWLFTTEYQIGDTVTYGGYSYIAKTNHIGSIPTNSPLDWEVFTTGFNFRGDYNPATDYLVGDVVRYGAYTYVAVADSTEESIEDTEFWSRLNYGIRWTNNSTTYEDIPGTNVIGSGSDALFNIIRNNTVYTVTVADGGSGYDVDDVIRIPGSSVGGLSPVNDIVVTVTGVNTGVITDVTSTGISVTWKVDVNYVLGDVALFGATSFICVQEHTATLLNRPDQDRTGTYWNILASGAESAILTTEGDMLFYGENGPTRLPIGGDGQLLRVSNGFPSWAYYGVVNNIVYVAPEGVDTLVEGQGLTIDKPWRSVRFACDQVNKGYQYANTRELLDRNKQFIMKEVTNWVNYTYSVTITATDSGADSFTCDSTANLIVNMPFEFQGTVFGSVDTGTTYYVKQILSPTAFTISTVAGGAIKELTSATGTMIGTLSYDYDFCERDTGLIVEAVAYDVTHGGTEETTTAAKAYYTTEGSAYINSNFGAQIVQTTAAYAYLKTLILNVLANEQPDLIYQELNGITDKAQQYIDTSLIVSAEVPSLVTNLLDIIINGINAGTVSAIRTAVIGQATVSVKTGTYYETLPIIIPKNTAIVGDELRSSVVSPSYAIDLLANDKPKSITALERIKDVASDLIRGVAVTPSTENTAVQQFAFGVKTTDGTDSVNSNTDLMVDIVKNGLTAADSYANTMPYPPLTARGQVYRDARDQLIQNKAFLQAEVTAWIAVQKAGNISPFTSGFTYDADKCARDVGYIVDALAYDTTYGGNLETTVAARAYFSGVTATYGTGEKEETLAAYAYLKSIVDNIVTATTFTKSVGNALSQDTSTYGAGDAGTATFVQARVQEIYDTINTDGTLATEIAPSITWVAPAVNTANTALLGIKADIQADSITWVQDNYPTLTFNTVTCSRDVGFIIDALRYDFMFGSNFRSKVAARSYLRNLTSTGVVLTSQLAPTLGIIDYVGDRVQDTTEGTQLVIDNGTIISDILTAGLIAVPTTVLVDPADYDVGFLNARAQIVANTAFIIDEVEAYMSANYSSLWTSLGAGGQADCTRDIGYILEALVYDMTYGGNLETSVAARSYYSNGLFVEPSGEKTAALAVQARIKDIIDNIILEDTTWTKSVGNVTVQNTSGTAGSTDAVDFAQARIQEVYDTINTGITPIEIPPSLTWVDEGLASTHQAFQTQKAQIQSGAISWISETYPDLVYNEALCSRDVGYMIDAIGYDMMFGSNFRSIKAGMAYYRGTTSAGAVIDDQLAETTATITYIINALTAITNGNFGDVGSLDAVNSVIANTNIIYDIVDSGFGAVPTELMPAPIGFDTAGYGNARTQILNNYAFIKADVSQFITNNYLSVWTALGSEGQATCQRDIGYILDAIRYDLTYGGNTQSLIAGRSYYSYLTLVIDSTELTATLAAYTHLKSIIDNIVLKTAVTPQAGNIIPQNTSGTAGSADAATFAQNRVQDVIDWIEDGFSPTEIAPSTAWVSAEKLTAWTELQSKKEEIKADGTTWVKKFHQYLNFNEATCARDIGYIVDALAYDFAFGSNFASIKAGMSYHRATESAQVVVGNQKAAQLGMINFLKYKVKSVVATGGVAQVSSAIDDIIGFIQGGAVPRLGWTDPSDIVAGFATARTLIWDNKEFLKAEVIEYITDNYPSIEYNQDLCARDVGYIVDALRYDLTYGGNSQSVEAAESYYSALTDQLQIDSADKAATLAAYGYLKTLVQAIAVNTTVTPLQTVVKQTVGYTGGTVGAQTAVGDLMDDIIDIIDDIDALGTTVTISYPSTAGITATVLAVQTTLQAAKASIQASVTTFIGTNYPNLVYDTVTCERDVGYIVDALGWDYILGSNMWSVKAGMSYYRAQASVVLDDQKVATLAAFRHLKRQAVTAVILDSAAVASVKTNMNIIIDILDKGIGETPEFNGTNTYRNSLGTFRAIELLRTNKDFIAAESSAWIREYYASEVVSSSSSEFTTSASHRLSVGDPVEFVGTTFGGVAEETIYFVATVSSSTTFGITLTQGSTTASTLPSGTGSMIVRYAFNEASCQRDSREYIDAVIYDLQYPGNYKSLSAAQIYLNAVNGSRLSDMFRVRNGTGLRNCTLTGLNGELSELNDFDTQRPTAGAYVALDPGFGPNDYKSWVTRRSHYSQNVSMFGTGCSGAKIDSALHAGGNKSMVKNDFTTILSEGIGVWCTGSDSLTELVSVFNYYGYAGYLAEFGGRIRATNGNSSYGTYGVIAEGTDTYEQPINAVVNNRNFQAQITNTLTDGVNEVLGIEFDNAGGGYSNVSYLISGAGFAAAAVGDEFRDGAVFETRLIDPANGEDVGGSGYITASNVAQGGATGYITIANTDTALSNAYIGMRIQLTAGTGAGQFANIVAYNNGTKEAYIVKDSFATLTITNTTSSGNLLTTSSTVTMYANMPVIFTGTTFGGIDAGEVYYVLSGFTATQFTVSDTSGGSAITLTTASGSMSLTEAGWDNVIPGKTTANALDLTTGYIIEPRLNYTAPGFTSTARTITSATWQDVTYGGGRFVAVANGSTNSSFSSDGNSWGSAGALVDTTQKSIVFGGGENAVAYAVVGGLGGAGAVLEAVLGVPNTLGNPTADQVASVRVISGGQGYTTPPVIVFTPVTGGSGARAVCTVLNGAIANVTVEIPGSGYSVAPTVTAATDRVTDIVLTSWGRNYSASTLPTITILGGGYSTQAIAVPTVDSATGGITNIKLVDSNGIDESQAAYLGFSGVGYTSTPSVIITDANARYVSISGSTTTSGYQLPASLGSAWTAGGTLPASNFASVAYGVTSGTGVFVAVGGASGGATSALGTSWTPRTLPTASGTYVDIKFGGTKFVAISTSGSSAFSINNGASWTAGATLPGAITTWSSLAYGNGRFVAVATSQRAVAVSVNGGVSWTSSPAGLPSSQTWTKVEYGQGLFVAVASGTNVCATSPDGLTWTVRTISANTTWNAVAFGNPSSVPTWVALSTNTAASLIRTGATARARAKVADNTITEIRMTEPGSGYPRGTVSATTATTNLITVNETTNIIANQPIEFYGASTGGLVQGVTYYVVSGTITSTQFKVSATSGSATAVTLDTVTGITGMTYRAGPILTQTDPNKVETAATRVRVGDGALGNPTFTNRGSENVTASTTLAGDGRADLYQPGSFINVKNLFDIPLPGANIQFSSLPGQYFKLVAVTNILGIDGNKTAQFQVNPDISVLQAPSDNVDVTTTIKYSQVRLTGHDFLYIGTGNFERTNYPNVDISLAVQANQSKATAGGRVFFTSTDQDGNFNVGNLFGVQQATGTATLNASAFNLSGLQSLQLGSVAIGIGSAIITQFSTDPFFTADSDTVVPTQRAIRAYITSQIGGGASSLNVNTLTSGVVFIAGNSITTTTGVAINVNAKMNFTGGIDGAPVALGFFLQR